MEFWTIEILDGPRSSARLWRAAYSERLIEAALTRGGKDWTWRARDWGVLLEVSFADESDWLRFRATPAVQAALDAVPDPVQGLFVSTGRGGSSGARVPRRPRPRIQPDGGAATRAGAGTAGPGRAARRSGTRLPAGISRSTCPAGAAPAAPLTRSRRRVAPAPVAQSEAIQSVTTRPISTNPRGS